MSIGAGQTLCSGKRNGDGKERNVVNFDPVGELDDAQAKLAAADFDHFYTYLWGPMEPHQRLWAEVLMRPGNDVIVAPPGTWKTTFCQRLTAFLMGKEPEHPSLWIMNSDEQAARNIMAVAQIVTDRSYLRVFPEVRPDKARGWNKSDLFQKHGPKSPDGARQKADPSLAGRGITSDYQGMHPAHIIIDDPTKPQDMTQQATMSQQRNLVRGMIYDRLRKNQGCLANGIKVILTRWGSDDLVDTFKRMGFTINEFPIIGDYPWGELLFPREYPEDAIQTIREAKTTVGFEDEFYNLGDVFNMTYMCRPEQTEGIMVKREWWKRYYGPPEWDNLLRHAIGWDFSTGVARDFTTWLYGAVTYEGVYLLGGGKGKWTQHEVLEKMKVVDTAISPETHAVEWAGISIPIIQEIERTLPQIPLKKYTVGRQTKPARLSAIAHMVQAGKVFIPVAEDAPWAKELIEQCANMRPQGESPGNDDYVDAFVWLMNYIQDTGGIPRRTERGSSVSHYKAAGLRGQSQSGNALGLPDGYRRELHGSYKRI